MDIKQQHIRNFLRILAGIVLIAYTYDIAMNKVQDQMIHLNVVDGYIILGCVSMLLAIEAVRDFVQRKIKK